MNNLFIKFLFNYYIIMKKLKKRGGPDLEPGCVTG